MINLGVNGNQVPNATSALTPDNVEGHFIQLGDFWFASQIERHPCQLTLQGPTHAIVGPPLANHH